MAPDVDLEDKIQLRRSEFFTGVPTFLGVMANPSEMLRNEKTPNPHLLCLWSHFGDYIGTPTQDCWLAYAVRGFFENGGRAIVMS